MTSENPQPVEAFRERIRGRVQAEVMIRGFRSSSEPAAEDIYTQNIYLLEVGFAMDIESEEFVDVERFYEGDLSWEYVHL